jgi:NACHT domain
MRSNDPSRYLAWLRAETADSQHTSLDSLEESLVHPRLLIVGPAGSGKTAFLQHVAFLWCCGLQDARTWSLLFPIFIRLPEAAAYTGCGWLADFLESRSRVLDWGLDAAFFRKKLGAAFVFLDGLEEAPSTAGLIEETAAANPLSRFAVASRPGTAGLAGFHSTHCRAGHTPTL